MKPRFSFIIRAFALASLITLGCWAQQLPMPQQLLDSAHSAEDLSSVEPYVLSAEITLNASDKKRQKTGRLKVTRDHDRARVELELGGTREIRTFIGSKEYVLPGQSFLFTARLFDFDHLWDPESRLFRDNVNSNFGNVHQGKVGGRPAWCTERKTHWGKESRCFDVETSLLVRETGPRGETEFLDFTKAGEHSYPQEVHILEKPLAPIKISHITVQRGKSDEAFFQPPAGALEFGSCREIKEPKEMSTPDPVFTKASRMARANGLVVIYVIIDKNGKVVFVRALQDDEYGLAAESERAIKNWVFQPASCDDHAVNTEMIVQVEFSSR
jgi:Gram-negative bacterial TonB protein C-terminal